MDIEDILRRECIQIGAQASDKPGLLREISLLAKKSDVLKAIDVETIALGLKAREEVMSTGFENGVAIPHCILDGISEFVVGAVVIPAGIDFGSLDGKPTRLAFFIIGPQDQRNRHIQILSALSKVARNPEALDQIIAAADAPTVKRIVLEYAPYGRREPEQKGKCLFHVFIQKEDFFEDILHVLSANIQGSISVIEANGASYYLHRLPLFAAYWNQDVRTSYKIICAVVDKNLCNDLIRRISMVAEILEEKPGVMIAVQDLLFCVGSLEF